jgi:Zn-dependent M28 family amino/carboxypeptidase
MIGRLLRNKRALGAPVGNLIILMAAVILSTTVVLFATNVTTSQVQKENLYVASSHVWYVANSTSVAAIAVTNTGPTDIVLAKIVVKGQQCAWNNVSYSISNETLQGDLLYSRPANLTVATEGLALKSGWTLVAYIDVADRIIVYDLANPVRIVISTTQSVYCTETLVQTT